MRAVCDREALEALISGTLPPERAFEVQAHARTCASCSDELSWLRTERRLMNERKSAEPGLPSGLWRAVEMRIARPRSGLRFQLRRLAFPLLSGAAALAAAVVLMWPHPAGRAPVLAPVSSMVSASTSGVNQVLDAALVEYQQAVAVLERDLRRSRGKLPAAEMEALERRFGPARQQLGELGAGDAESRLRTLDGYADYVRSLQAVVVALEGGGP